MKTLIRGIIFVAIGFLLAITLGLKDWMFWALILLIIISNTLSEEIGRDRGNQ
jgi:hypothetical protein